MMNRMQQGVKWSIKLAEDLLTSLGLILISLFYPVNILLKGKFGFTGIFKNCDYCCLAFLISHNVGFFIYITVQSQTFGIISYILA